MAQEAEAKLEVVVERLLVHTSLLLLLLLRLLLLASLQAHVMIQGAPRGQQGAVHHNGRA